MATFAETPAPIGINGIAEVIGKCVAGSSPIEVVPKLFCNATGHWVSDVSGSCDCMLDYVRVHDRCLKRGPLCFTCESDESPLDCAEKSSNEQCAPDEICETSVISVPSFRLRKRCVPRDQCKPRVDHLEACLTGNITCSLCCDKDYCNFPPVTEMQPKWSSPLPKCEGF